MPNLVIDNGQRFATHKRNPVLNDRRRLSIREPLALAPMPLVYPKRSEHMSKGFGFLMAWKQRMHLD